MKALTLKKMVDCETGNFGFSILGVVVCECCIHKLIENNEEYLNKLHEKFEMLDTSTVIGHPDGVVIIGKIVDELDENKSIKQLKEEIELDLIEFGIISDNVDRFNEGIIFINGAILMDENEIEEN